MLRCRTFDGSTEGDTDYFVLRDFELRRSLFDGQSVEYNSDGDSFTANYTYASHTKRVKTISGTAETQVIVPYYKVDFTVILAARLAVPISVSGVINADLTVETKDINLVEISSGRAWAKLAGV